MTLNALPAWANNLNYSTGPDTGTPTKVDPASAANGFIKGVVAAPQHVNYLLHAIVSELVKAIDGVNGGTYTLSAELVFDGDEVHVASVLRVLPGATLQVAGAINLLPGSELDVNAGADVTLEGALAVADGGVINVNDGAVLDMNAGAQMTVDSGATVDVAGTVNLNPGSELNVNSSAAANVAGTGKLTVTGGGQLNLGSVADHVGASAGEANVGFGALLNVKAGGVLVVEDGGRIVSNPTGGITLEESGDLTINNSAGDFQLTMAVAFHDGLAPWAPTTDASLLAGWVQFDVSARRRIMFPLPLVPGDTLVNVFVRVHGDPSGGGAHGGVRPTNVATVELLSVDLDGAITVLATKDDPVSAADYDTAHYIILETGTLTTGAMPQLATPNPFYVRVRGEQGGSAAAAKLTILSVSGNTIARKYRAQNMVY
jgi:hypothetical protein